MLIAALVIAGWVAAYLGLREMLKRSCEEVRRELQDEINLLHMKIRLHNCAVVEGAAAEPTIQTVLPVETSAAVARRSELIAWPVPVGDLAASEEASPAIMALIAETVTGFLGKRVGIRSARKISGAASAPASSEGAEPWSQQGRVLVQGSHQSVHQRASGTAESATNSVNTERARP